MTSNVATIAPLRTAYPVSASPQYIDASGAIVTDKEYQVVQPFAFTQVVQAPMHRTTVTALAFEPDLDRVMSAAHGDAIVGMKVAAISYDRGSHQRAASWKLSGWTLGVVGTGVAVTGLALGSLGGGSHREEHAVAIGGGVVAGLGVLFYLIGLTHHDPSTWRLEVSGRVVKRTSPAVQAPPPDADTP